MAEEHGEVNRMCTGPAALKVPKCCLLGQLSWHQFWQLGIFFNVFALLLLQYYILNQSFPLALESIGDMYFGIRAHATNFYVPVAVPCMYFYGLYWKFPHWFAEGLFMYMS